MPLTKRGLTKRGITTLGASALLIVSMFSFSMKTDNPVVSAGMFESLESPRRILDTRPGSTTDDGQAQAIGIRDAGTTLRLRVAGRVGIPADAASVVLNLTVTQPQAPGFATVFPCGQPVPTASNLNYQPGQTVANAVVAKLGTDGDICIFTLSSAHYVVDISGYFIPENFEPLASPQRLLDSRPGEVTADGAAQAIGALTAGSITRLDVSGRAGIPGDADAVVMNLTVTQPQAIGFATVFPCGQPVPNASSLNYQAGQTVANAVVAKLGTGGDVCIFTLATAHYIVDVSGYFPAGTFESLAAPQRLLDTRPGESTADGQFAGAGAVGAGTSIRLRVAGRVGVPANATAVVLNITATEPQAPGFATIYPRGTDRPIASNLNFTAGQTVANAVVAKVGVQGDICLFSLARAHYIVDVTGYLVGDPPPTSGSSCPAPVVPPPAETPEPTAPTSTGPTLWWEDFQTASSMDRLVKEVHAGDPTNFVPRQFHGDHNQNCEGPTTGRALTEDHTVGTHFWWCAPGGDPAKGHFMTGIDTGGYVIISFSPKDDATGAAQVFPPSANRICWDQNLTDLGGRKWTQLMVISEATYLANGRTISYLNPGNPDNFSVVNPQARPSGDDFTIKFLKHTLETFSGQRKVNDNFFVALNGVTDKAARYRNCVTDNGNGTITRTQDRPGGTRSETTFPGAFPAGNRVFILGDDNYNVLKSYEEGATQFVSDPFTWHWDNLEIS
jgi:hypothetical protein